jgi:hypothetical protein
MDQMIIKKIISKLFFSIFHWNKEKKKVRKKENNSKEKLFENNVFFYFSLSALFKSTISGLLETDNKKLISFFVFLSFSFFLFLFSFLFFFPIAPGLILWLG